MPEQEIITQLAKEYLNEKGQEDVADFLLNNELGLAKIAVLAAIDYCWKNKEINDAEAAEAYQMLGVPKEEASRVRQRSKHWQ